jgi:hypothetical protein
MLLALTLALLPPCDFTIRETADWKHVNDPDKSVICVAPAPTYTVEQVGVLKLTASGTADRPRWLRWANEDESLHPALVPEEQTAAISGFDITGSHWIIDRLVVRDEIGHPGINAAADGVREAPAVARQDGRADARLCQWQRQRGGRQRFQAGLARTGHRQLRDLHPRGRADHDQGQ